MAGDNGCHGMSHYGFTRQITSGSQEKELMNVSVCVSEREDNSR